MKDYSKSKIPFIFELLESRGISQKQLSDAIQVSTGNISDWKSGKSSPKPDAIIKIAEYLNVSTDYLLGKETETVTLSPKQQKVLDLYNSLSPEQQASFEQLLDNLLGLKK